MATATKPVEQSASATPATQAVAPVVRDGSDNPLSFRTRLFSRVAKTAVKPKCTLNITLPNGEEYKVTIKAIAPSRMAQDTALKACEAGGSIKLPCDGFTTDAGTVIDPSTSANQLGADLVEIVGHLMTNTLPEEAPTPTAK